MNIQKSFYCATLFCYLIVTLPSCKPKAAIRQFATKQSVIKHNIETKSSPTAFRITEPRSSRESTIKLSDNFEIILNVGKQRDYNNLQLFHKGKKIDLGRRDSADYIIEDKRYPILNKINEHTFELLIEDDNRPDKNVLRFFRIVNDVIVAKDILPTFIANPSDLDNDSVLEYAGVEGFYEQWDKDGKRYMTTDPILYYKLTKDGIKLDSTLTIERNIMIFGRFYGFKFDGKNGVDVSLGCNERLHNEMKRIANNVK